VKEKQSREHFLQYFREERPFKEMIRSFQEGNYHKISHGIPFWRRIPKGIKTTTIYITQGSSQQDLMGNRKFGGGSRSLGSVSAVPCYLWEDCSGDERSAVFFTNLALPPSESEQKGGR